jgi:hypothetical protein
MSTRAQLFDARVIHALHLSEVKIHMCFLYDPIWPLRSEFGCIKQTSLIHYCTSCIAPCRPSLASHCSGSYQVTQARYAPSLKLECVGIGAARHMEWELKHRVPPICMTRLVRSASHQLYLQARRRPHGSALVACS